MAGDAQTDSLVGSVPSIEAFLQAVARAEGVDAHHQIVHIEKIAPREPEYASLSPPLPPPLEQALRATGIRRLYTHQVEALKRAREGQNVIVVTSTSSGKTLCYNLAVLETILADRQSSALYLYPVNALVNDQFKALGRMNLALGHHAVGIARYTGAVNEAMRKAVRARQPNILFTNPEMLHFSLLWWHPLWEHFWSHLRYVVVDEIHTYRGVFGANMAHLFQRLRRMAAHYGASPQFIACSATIANPQDLAETLTGLPFTVVDRDGSGRGKRYFVLWNPPLAPDADPARNVRRSCEEEAVNLLRRCLEANYQTIVFARARAVTERMLRLSLKKGPEEELPQVGSYRAGYLAEEREEIESALKEGRLRGVITTNALEMGVDIGGLDVAILTGYPGTIMSTWQQAGRAGRRGREALIFLIASQNALDQYYVRHPEHLFSQPHELAVVDLHNPHIRLKHLLCAARELPLTPAEVEGLEASWRAAVQALCDRQILRADADGRLSFGEERRDVHPLVWLRSAGHESYRLLDEHDREVGLIEPPHVFREAHPGAIYMHRGEAYRVLALDRGRHTVRVREEKAPHYTRSLGQVALYVQRVEASRPIDFGGLSLRALLASVQVEETIEGYQELTFGENRLVRHVILDTPLSLRLRTTAMALALPEAIRAALEEKGMALAEGLHAIEHLLTGVMPLLVMCDRADVDGFHTVYHAEANGPAIFLYDAYEGGAGLAGVAYQHAERLLTWAYATVFSCPCAEGCPSCIHSGACRVRNEALSKKGALAILQGIFGGDPPPPMLPEEKEPALRLAPSLEREGATLPDEMARAVEELDALTRRKGLAISDPTPRGPAPTFEGYRVGDEVEHLLYGRGVVTQAGWHDGRYVVTVRFAHRGLVCEIDAADRTLSKRA